MNSGRVEELERVLASMREDNDKAWNTVDSLRSEKAEILSEIEEEKAKHVLLTQEMMMQRQEFIRTGSKKSAFYLDILEMIFKLSDELKFQLISNLSPERGKISNERKKAQKKGLKTQKIDCSISIEKLRKLHEKGYVIKSNIRFFRCPFKIQAIFPFGVPITITICTGTL